ncbi:MAG: hypothetical protein DMF66_15755 [Acidobacteria bacterium]|nr:MAG: hypothetical protein DMF66_15755 [Acidobacteriota bacterium]
MLAILFLVGAALFGACLVRRGLRCLLDGAETLMWGTVAGWSLATVFIYLLARWQGRLTHALMAWATAAVWLAAASLLPPKLRRLKHRLSQRARLHGLWRPHYAGLAFVLLLFAPLYWLLFSTHTLARGEGGVYSGGSAFYDLSFHAALASSFAYGQNFPAIYTPLPPEPLLYPFMPDFLTAALMAAGLGLRAAMLATALPLALVVTGLFYTFALRLVRTQRAAALATILFLLNGGLGFIDLMRDWRASGRSFPDFWDTLAVNYANAWERGIHWTNLVADTLLPQRTSLFGLPLGLMVFTLFAVVWRRGYEGSVDDEKNRGGERSSAALLLAAGVLAGLLPLFHTHTFVAVGLVSLFLFALRPRREWLAFWTPALLLAAPQLFALSRATPRRATSCVCNPAGWARASRTSRSTCCATSGCRSCSPSPRASPRRACGVRSTSPSSCCSPSRSSSSSRRTSLTTASSRTTGTPRTARSSPPGSSSSPARGGCVRSPPPSPRSSPSPAWRRVLPPCTARPSRARASSRTRSWTPPPLRASTRRRALSS